MLQVEQLTTVQGAQSFCWSFSLEPGQFMAVVGASGVGKSTLLKTLLGFNQPVSGRLRWQQQDLLGLSVAQRPFGVLFQQDNLFEHLNVETNLALGLSASARLSRTQRQQLLEAAERFQIGDLLSEPAAQLSGGQQQRVALARVFMQNKPVLLLDEPFSALDPALRLDGLNWVSELQQAHDTTIIMVTHHLNEVLPRVDHVLQGVSSADWNQYPAREFARE